MDTEKGFCIQKNTSHDQQPKFEEFVIFFILYILLGGDKRPQLLNVNFLVIIILLQLTSQ